jgi:hypothetical protein
MMDINISKKNHHFIMPCVEFWWMDEKWCEHDIVIIVIHELQSVENNCCDKVVIIL